MKNITIKTKPVQLPLFENKINESISVEEGALELGVSSATIRNWIKTGLLELKSKGAISKRSIEDFKKNVAGKTKLKQRANKSNKDSHDHDKLQTEFLEKVRLSSHTVESLGSIYESKISESYKNKEGIYYTPRDIVFNLFELEGKNLEQKRFCDPCCGSGNFLIRAIEIGFKPENVFGFDTDPVAVEISKKRIREKTGFNGDNIKCADFLETAIRSDAETYEYIFTNPPWGKKIDPSQKRLIGNHLNAGSSLDTSSLFYFACIKMLKPKGTLGLLLPEAFFNVATYEDARTSMLSFTIKKLFHYGKPFKGLFTPAVGIIITKESGNPSTSVACHYDGATFERTTLSFIKNPKSIFNISSTADDADVISHIYALPHLTLTHNATWALGIVTGNNGKFVKTERQPGLVPVLKGSDITEKGLKPASSFIQADFSDYQQVAPIHLYKSPKKLIYKFISSNLRFFYDTEQHLILNSANMLIVNESFPVPMNVICELFNGEFMNWIFCKIFKTHKILKSDLESLPIHDQFLKSEKFIEDTYLECLNIERVGNGTFRVKRKNY